MSGIVGIYHLDQSPVGSDDLHRMIHMLAHRGPDGADSWCEGYVGLGHRMLKSTPESLFERLPLTEDSFVLTADARIDNRDELIAVLQMDKCPAEKIADSEVILAAYKRWGEQCLDKLLGDFAFAIWDSSEQKMFCARDHFGIKPFYYHASAALFAFATEIKAILCLHEVPRHLNEMRIADYLTGMFHDTTSTSYQEIYRLPPAHKMTVCADGIQVTSYWKLDPDRELPSASDEEYAEQFRQIFQEAVRCRLRSAYTIGTTLSGGLDSSSITCMARRLLAEREQPLLHSFSAVFDDTSECDERPYIEAVLAQGEIVSHYTKGNQQGPLEHIDTMLWHQDEAFCAPNWAMNWPIYQEAHRQGVRVILDGFDGDTTVSDGYGYLSELARANRWISLTREVKGLSKTFGGSFQQMLWSYIRYYGIEPIVSKNRFLYGLRKTWRWMQSQNQKVQPAAQPEWQALLDEDFAERLKLSERHENWRKTQGHYGLDERQRHYRNIATQGLTVFAAEVMDKTMAAFSIEPRYPFWDKRLVEFCLALPANQKLSGGLNRIIMRRAMNGILPAEVQWRRGKANFASNLSLGLTDELSRLEQMTAKVSLLSSYVNETAVKELYQRLLKEPSYADACQLWTVLSLAAWMHHAIRRGGMRQGNSSSQDKPFNQDVVISHRATAMRP